MATTFKELELPENLQKALQDKGFIEPTPIQEQVIPLILQDQKDLIALAQTGTGKTAAFSLPVLSKLDLNSTETQLLVLSPTRELAMQIADDIKEFSKYMGNLRMVTVYGGSSIGDQIRQVKKGVQIVVGTPGRMLDLLKRKVLKLENVKWAVLDEADEMLNMGFVEDISTILAETPKEKQTLLFSATMSSSVEKIARKYMHNPGRVEVKATADTKAAITHQYMMVPSRDKITAFLRYRTLHPEMYGIIFCRTKRETQEMGDSLLKKGCAAGVLHGDIEQRHRTRIMDAFKRKDIRLLVATDVAARGIDVEKLTHVIHVGVPEKIESYVHRSGRTGRANEKGISMVLAHLREHGALKKIERMHKITFEEIPVPKREDMILADINKYIAELEEDREFSNKTKKYVDSMLSEISKDELSKIAKKALLLAVESKINEHPEEDLDRSKNERRERERKSSVKMQTLVISLGRRDGLTVPNLLGVINDVSRGERVDVGHIQLGPHESSFEVPPYLADKLCESMSQLEYKGKSVIVSPGDPIVRDSRPRRNPSRGGNFRGGNRRRRR